MNRNDELFVVVVAKPFSYLNLHWLKMFLQLKDLLMLLALLS